MTTHRDIASSETDPFAPIVAALMKALALNPVAIAEGATGAPYVATGWHPYNGVNVGDAATGIIYNFAVHGAVANVVSPDFEDGYEYLFICDGMASATAVTGFRVELYRETSASYSTAHIARAYSSIVSAMLHARIEVKSPRITSRGFVIDVQGHENSGSNTNSSTGVTGVVTVATAQKILRARLSYDVGNIAGGTIRMLRRLAF